MTEEEAKAKWCPFVSLTGSGRDITTSRGLDIVAGVTTRGQVCSCLGSQCMAWRAARGSLSSMQRIEKIKEYRSKNGCGLVEAKNAIEKDFPLEGGYCGLAGRP